MSEATFFSLLLWASFVLAAGMFVVLMRWPAPYGRHANPGWGRAIAARWGWVLMEAPASVLFLAWYLAGDNRSVVGVVFLVLWQAHYVERAFHYPFTLSSSARALPVLIVLFGVLFNSVNTYINARYLFTFSPGYDSRWLMEPRFVAGLALFAFGYAANRWSDWTLARERARTGGRYCQVDKGLFRYVCCPNYFGELLIWSGWALATWSLAGLSFALWTAANLVPRARAHLRWCRANIDHYPEGRCAILPGLW